MSEDIHFGRDDDDEMKVKAMEFFLPRGEKVGCWRLARCCCCCSCCLLWCACFRLSPPPPRCLCCLGHTRLLHTSCTASPPPPPPSPRGLLCARQVWVKVLEVRPDAGGARLAASMRAVNQEDGTDLDPDNVLALAGECDRAGQGRGALAGGRRRAGKGGGWLAGEQRGEGKGRWQASAAGRAGNGLLHQVLVGPHDAAGSTWGGRNRGRKASHAMPPLSIRALQAVAAAAEAVAAAAGVTAISHRSFTPFTVLV